MNDKVIVVNLFGAPGAGKSTGAAYIFSQLKMAGINAELVTEYAKDKVWEEDKAVFDNQAYIFGKQSLRLSRCKDKVSVIITDSPLPLSILYNKDPILGEDFNRTVMNVFNSYNNMSYLLYRVKPYNPAGRFQTEEESDEVAEELRQLLDSRNISYIDMSGDMDGYDKIVSSVLNVVNEIKND